MNKKKGPPSKDISLCLNRRKVSKKKEKKKMRPCKYIYTR